MTSGPKDESTMLYSKVHSSVNEWALSIPRTNSRATGRSVTICASATSTAPPCVQLVGDADPPLYLARSVPRSGGYLHFQVECAELLDFFGMLDEYARHVAVEKCEEWFGKKMSAESIATMHKPLVTHDNGVAIVSVRLSGTRTQTWKCRVEGEQMKCARGELEDVTHNACYWPTVYIGGLYFMHRNFGITLLCKDILMFPLTRNIPVVTTRLQIVSDQADESENIIPEDEGEVPTHASFSYPV